MSKEVETCTSKDTQQVTARDGDSQADIIQVTHAAISIKYYSCSHTAGYHHSPRLGIFLRKGHRVAILETHWNAGQWEGREWEKSEVVCRKGTDMAIVGSAQCCDFHKSHDQVSHEWDAQYSMTLHVKGLINPCCLSPLLALERIVFVIFLKQ